MIIIKNILKLLKYFASNIKDYNITGFVCVPLVIEMIYKRIIKELEKRKSNLDTKNELSPKESTMERMVLSKLVKVSTLIQKEEEEAIELNFRLIDYYIEKIKEISK